MDFENKTRFNTPRNDHFKHRTNTAVPNTWTIPLQNQFQVLRKMTEDDNEVENPFQNRLTNDRNKSATTFVKPVMPAKNTKKQSTNRSSRKVETPKPGFISANNSQTSRGNSAEISRFNQYNEASGLIPGSSSPILKQNQIRHHQASLPQTVTQQVISP